jgi:hypothetical protein
LGSAQTRLRVFDKDYPAKLIVECDDKSSAVSSPG